MSNDKQNMESDNFKVKETEKGKLPAKLAGEVKAIFKAHPKEDTVFVTEDGQIFLKKNETYAKNHAARNGAFKREKVLSYFEVRRSEV